MATGMADLGQCIVLGVEVDQTATRAALCFKGGIETECVASDREALFF